MAPIQFVTNSEWKADLVKEKLGKFFDVEVVKLDLVPVQSLDIRTTTASKIEIARKFVRGSILVEEISLMMPGLGGLPGPMVKWFLDLGMDKFYGLYSAVENKDVIYVSTFGLFIEGELEPRYFSHQLCCKLVPPTGKGVGFEPVLLPEGWPGTLAELTGEDKEVTSPRRGALLKMVDHILATKVLQIKLGTIISKDDIDKHREEEIEEL